MLDVRFIIAVVNAAGGAIGGLIDSHEKCLSDQQRAEALSRERDDAIARFNAFVASKWKPEGGE